MSSERYIDLDANAVKAQISSLFESFGEELDSDEELLRDALEGETGFYEILERIYTVRARAEETILGAKARMTEIKARVDRLEGRSEAYNALMLSLMQMAKQDRAELIEATLSVRKPSKRVEIDDVDALPQGMFEIIRKPDKKAIADQFKAGEEIPGARYVDGDFSLTVKKT